MKTIAEQLIDDPNISPEFARAMIASKDRVQSERARFKLALEDIAANRIDDPVRFARKTLVAAAAEQLEREK